MKPRKLHLICIAVIGLIGIAVIGCAPKGISVIESDQGTEEDADKLLVVDCLLPGQIKRLGAGMTYVTPRRPAKLSAVDCESRGGEYVAYGQANHATALKVWLPAAEEGDKVAQTYVGEIYEKGYGIEPDYKIAALWYQKAAAQGDSRAKLNLGYLYERGLGVPQDLAQALALYRDASSLKESDFEYVAAVNSSDIQGAEQMQRLKNELEAEKEKTVTLTKQVDSAQAEVAQVNAETIRQDAEIETLRASLSKTATSTTGSQDKVRQLKEQLKQKEDEVQKQRARSALLAKQLDTYGRELNQAQSRTKIAIAGPSVQLTKPLLVSVRGNNAVSADTAVKTHEIMGKVNAPAGLKSLIINEKPESVDAQGMFRVLVALSEQRTPISIVAIDTQDKRAIVEFTFVRGLPPQQASAPIGKDVEAVAGDFSHYYALVIGNNDYKQFNKLDTPVNDAKMVADVLSKRYGFQATTLVNANRYMMLAALTRISQRMTDKDNLLIYFAGHGELDASKSEGYWLPVDADKTNRRKWLANKAISDIISSMQAKRVLVIADSCYAGTLTATSLPQVETGSEASRNLRFLRTVAKSRARTALTSGGISPVADKGVGNHSVFAGALLDILNGNQQIMEGQKLHRELVARVAYSPEASQLKQVPQYAPIRHAGHESGEFFFLPHSG